MLLHEISELIEAYGYAGIFISLTLESFGAPLPAESLLVIAFGFAGRGELDPRLLFLVAWLAAVLGDNIGYILGRLAGRRLLGRFGAYVHLTAARRERLEERFRRHGPFLVIVARFFLVLRQLNGILAGTMAMPWWTFLACNMVGATIWVGFWGLLAYYFGANFDTLIAYAGHHRLVTAALAGTLLTIGLAYALLRFRRRP